MDTVIKIEINGKRDGAREREREGKRGDINLSHMHRSGFVFRWVIGLPSQPGAVAAHLQRMCLRAAATAPILSLPLSLSLSLSLCLSLSLFASRLLPLQLYCRSYLSLWTTGNPSFTQRTRAYIGNDYSIESYKMLLTFITLKTHTFWYSNCLT